VIILQQLGAIAIYPQCRVLLRNVLINYRHNVYATCVIFTQPWNNLNMSLDDWSLIAEFRSLIRRTGLRDFCV